MSEYISILIIDDVEVIRNGFADSIKKVAPEYNIYSYIPLDNIDNNKIIDDIANIISINQITHIISDRGFAKVRNDNITGFIYREKGNSRKIDDLICGVINKLDISDIERIQLLIIYTYDPISDSINSDLKDLRIKISNAFSCKINTINDVDYSLIKTIETSSIYRRPGKSGIYPNGLNENCVIGSYAACELYGKFLSDVIENIIKFDVTDDLDKLSPYFYNKPQNYEMLKYIRAIEGLIGNKKLSIGSVSCYGNIYGKPEYLVDVPFKKYYKDINKYIVRVDPETNKKDLSVIFNKEQDKKQDFTTFEWVLYEYDVYSDDIILIKKPIKSSIGLTNCEDICMLWLPLLHSSIYYCKENSWMNKIGDKNVISQSKCISSITVIFSIIAINENDFHGINNFTLYAENSEISIDKIELLLYEQYGQLIEAKLFESILPYKGKEIKKQALKAAISQVMARNSSHNIGSHVMNKLVGDLSKIKIENYKYISDITLDAINKERIEGIDSSEAEKSSVLFGHLAIFNNYVKCRMDYLSDITYGVPLMQTSKSAKEIFKDFDKVRLLLGNISGLTDFEYKINFRYPKGVDDLIFAMPNDVLGCQALYNIIENVIRNTAKHGNHDDKNNIKNTDGLVIFTLEFKEASSGGLENLKNELDELYEVTIYDNLAVSGSAVDLSYSEINDYKSQVYGELTLPDQIDNIDYLIWRQNTKINKSILNETNTLRASNLGLIEMKASACYLRKLDMTSMESYEYHIELGIEHANKTCNKSNKLNILKALKVDDNCLGYRFYVLKPTEVLIVSDNIAISLTDEHIRGG